TYVIESEYGDRYKSDFATAPGIHIQGGSGNDVFDTANGADTIDGGGGIDLVKVSANEQASQGIYSNIENYSFLNMYGTASDLGRSHGMIASGGISNPGNVSSSVQSRTYAGSFSDTATGTSHAVSIEHTGPVS